jgi:predicted nucleic acid-binding protein
MSLEGIPDYSIIITDTSCFILLDKIEAFEVLHKLFQNVTTTPEIQREFGSDLPSWVQIRSVKDIALMEVLKGSVDPGEASAIALAMETPNSLIIVDDLKGRKLATRMELNFMGTLGLLLKAKEHHIISHIRPYIDKIQITDFRISQSIVNYVLESAGENV